MMESTYFTLKSTGEELPNATSRVLDIVWLCPEVTPAAPDVLKLGAPYQPVIVGGVVAPAG